VRRHVLAALALLALAGCADAQPPRRAHADAGERLAYPLPARSHLSARAREFTGPRVIAGERTNGRTLTMYGDPDARSRVLVAGCVNGTRCAGTDVVNAAMVGCPPPDAELWYFAGLDPRGADLDAEPAHPGAQAFRQAAADLRPTIAIVFRTGPRALVLAAGPSVAKGRRYARLAGLPFRPRAGQGLAPWAATALRSTAAITVELPPGRLSARRAVALAYAIDRLAGTRFAEGADDDRRRMLVFGQDPRDSRH
jgi:hypothetical protein